MASNVADFGGYDYHFVDTPPDDLMCLICTCVARDPQQLVCCGRVYCRECLSNHRRNSHTCPHCRRVSADGFNDARSDRHIKELKVKCNNLGRGCEWTGELRSVEEHHGTCDYGLIQCPNHCMKDGKDVTLLRKNLGDHATKCPKRQFECPHCKETGEYHERTTSHLKKCPQFETACPNTPCTARPLNCELDQHRLVCQYEKVACKYAALGCQECSQRKDISAHESDLQRHIAIAMTTNKLLKEKVDRSEQGRYTPFYFKLTDFSKYKTNNVKFFSKPFYTHPGGYRMCTCVYANGSGEGKGTHLSVFACLMKGQNDDNISWPFVGTVTFSLLNQLADRNHHVESVEFDSEHKCSTRVQGDKEKGIGYGCPEFISHTDISDDIYYSCHYLKDDCLYFKVTVSVERRWLFSA